MRRHVAYRCALARRLTPLIRGAMVRLSLQPTAEEYYRSLHAPESDTWRGVVSAFEEIARRCEETETDCVLVLFPALIGVPYPLTDVHEQVSIAASAAGLEVIDLAAITDGGGARDFWVTPDDAHPNRIAHALYSRALLERVQESVERRAEH